MFNLLCKALGLKGNTQSRIESIVKSSEGDYYVIKVGDNRVEGVDKETARKQVKDAGGDPDIIDRLS